MITADFYKENDTLRLCVSGHADYAESGGDIVCAGVSGIVYALIGYLANSGIYLKINSLRSGCADIECSQRGEEALKQTCIGLIQIQVTYPGCVSVKNQLWNWRAAG